MKKAAGFNSRPLDVRQRALAPGSGFLLLSLGRDLEHRR